MLEIRELFLDGGRLYNNRRFNVTETKTPYFSWAAASDTDNDAQTAFRASVFFGKTELWDTGWVESREQGVKYAGKMLPAGRNLDFTLRIRNTRGEESELFGAQFVCGAIEEWKGKWIASDTESGDAAVCFRRDFKLEKPVSEACLFVSGIGCHKVTINGADTDDSHLDPAFSDYRNSCYYAVITNVEEFLENGDNTIGVTAAKGSSDEVCHLPMLNLMLLVHYTDGTKVCLCSDEKWKWKTGGVTGSCIFGGETYDASVSDPLWDQPDIAVQPDFRSVIVLDGPGGIMRPMALEPIRDREVYDPIALTEPERGTFIADFGQSITGVCSLILPDRMKNGQKVTIRFAEELDEDGFPVITDDQKDTYIASGDSRDLTVWTPEFTLHRFRYAEIKGVSLLDIHTLRAVARYTDIKNESSFRCGSAAANTLYKMVLQTEKENLLGAFAGCENSLKDGEQIFRATDRFEEMPYNFDTGRLFAKVMRDIRESNSAENTGSGAIKTHIYGSSYLIAGIQLFLHSGNADMLREAYIDFSEWEKCLLANSTDYIADCKRSVSVQNADTAFMATGYSYFNCVTLAYIAGLLSKEEEKNQYETLAGCIRDAFLAKWWNSETLLVGNGSAGEHAFALWLGILPETHRQAAAERLHTTLISDNGKAINNGFCVRYIPAMLAEYGYADDAWEIFTKEDYPSYGYMIQSEKTTVREEPGQKENAENDFCGGPVYGAVGHWFYAYLCGIKPVGRGFERVSIRPCYPQKLLSAQASVDTVKGQLSVRWVKRGEKTQLAVSVPFGMTAEVSVNGENVICGSGYHHFSF